MSWLYLLGAIIFEVSGTVCMKLSQGFTNILPSVMIFVFYALSFVAVTFAIRRIDLSVAYAVWAGLGTALISVLGIMYFKEPASALKIVSLGLVVVGVIGLNLSGGGH